MLTATKDDSVNSTVRQESKKGRIGLKRLKLGLPAGSLQESALEIFKKAGYNISIGERSYYYIDDEEIECVLIRAQEISSMLPMGFSTGLTGKDWIVETGVEVEEVAELAFEAWAAAVRLVLAVPHDSEIDAVADLEASGWPLSWWRPRKVRRKRGFGYRAVFLGRHRGQAAFARRCHRRAY